MKMSENLDNTEKKLIVTLAGFIYYAVFIYLAKNYGAELDTVFSIISLFLLALLAYFMAIYGITCREFTRKARIAYYCALGISFCTYILVQMFLEIPGFNAFVFALMGVVIKLIVTGIFYGLPLIMVIGYLLHPLFSANYPSAANMPK
jgi:hypothetical protein